MTKISEIHVKTVEIPLDKSVSLGGRSVYSREYCLIEILSEDGIKGNSISFTRDGDLLNTLQKNIIPLLIDKDIDQIEGIWEEIYKSNILLGGQGLVMRALSTVDLALWDMKSKRADLPLYQMLGGYKKSVPLIMAGGYYNDKKDINALVEEYKEYVELGFKNLKLMVGGATMEEDFNRFRAVKEALPSDITLSIDVNGVWKNPKSVYKWLNMANELGDVYFIEEPFFTEMLDDYRWLRDKTTSLIATGEFIAGRWSFDFLIKNKCADIIRADTTLCGGITEWKRIASIASSNNLKLIPHYFSSIHLNVALAFPDVEMIEVVSKKEKNSSFSLIAGDNYEIIDGIAHPKGLPGLGLSIDEELVEFYKTEELKI